MTLQPAKRAITMHILLNVLKSKGNQAMEFGQLANAT